MNMRWKYCIAVFVLSYLAIPLVSRASVRLIWALNDGEKLERDDLNNPNKSANSAWDGKRIKIFGARNEIIAFQLIIEADKSGISGLRVSIPELTHAGGAARIKYVAPATDPTNYVDRPIGVFSINYMN